MKFYFCGIIVLSLPLHPASVISRLPPSMAVTCPDNFLSLRPIAQLLHSTKCFAVCLQWTCVRLRWDGVWNGDHVTVFQYITSKHITFHREGVSSSCDTVSLICQTPWPLCPGQPGLNITLHYIILHYIHYSLASTLHYITLHYITLYYITLHYITLQTLYNITLYFTVISLSQQSWPQQIQINSFSIPFPPPLKFHKTTYLSGKLAECENISH